MLWQRLIGSFMNIMSNIARVTLTRLYDQAHKSTIIEHYSYITQLCHPDQFLSDSTYNTGKRCYKKTNLQQSFVSIVHKALPPAKP